MHPLEQLSLAIDESSQQGVDEALRIWDSYPHVKLSDQTKFNLLNKAVCGGSIAITQALLTKFPQVNFAPEVGKPLLHTAIEKIKDNLEMVKLLLHYGADINARWTKHKTPNGTVGSDNNAFHLAIKKGCESIVKLFLQTESGVDVKAKGWQGQTPLHFAARGHLNIAETLLDVGADPNEEDENEKTPIFKAVDSKCYESIDILLNRGDGADLNASDRLGNTLLHVAARNRGREGILKMFVNLGCDVNARNKAGDTPLHLAAPESYVSVKVLLDNGAEVDPKNKQKRTPLYYAATSWNDLNICQLLLSRGADMYSRDCNRKLIPHYFFKSFGSLLQPSLNAFLEFGFDMNALLEPYKMIKTVLEENRSPEGSSLVHYIALLMAQNVEIDGKFLILFNEGYRNESDVFEKCQEEIKLMKSTILENTSVTVFDILTRNATKLVTLVRNENVVKSCEKIIKKKPIDFSSFLCKSIILITVPTPTRDQQTAPEELKEETENKVSFPYYERIIDRQLRKGIARKALLEQCNKLSRVIFPQLNYACGEAVFNFLKDIELSQVIEACTPSRVYN